MDAKFEMDRGTVIVRGLLPKDLEAVIAVDAAVTGHRREEYYKVKLQQNLAEVGIRVSLAAELEGSFVGFLLARVFYGEFGKTERVAVLDTFAVHPREGGKGIGTALLRQLRVNLLGLGIRTLQTEVDWDEQELLSFFHRQGFRPAPRLCLEQDMEEVRRLEELSPTE